MFSARVEAYLQAEVERCKDEIDKLYWIFTRCANSKPPSVVNPGLYSRRSRAKSALRRWRRRGQKAQEKAA